MTNLIILSSILLTNAPSFVTFETTNGTMRMLRTVVERRTLLVEQVFEERFSQPFLVPVTTNKLTNMVKTLKTK